MPGRNVTKEEFQKACEAVWTEIEYQNTLDRRTGDEAASPPDFLTLGRVYINRTEADWADNPGNEKSLSGLRKLAGIFIRSMVYCGIRER